MQYQIKHHGAVNGVTGSCHELVASTGDSILIDCGLFQGAETSATGSNFDQLTIDFPIQQIKALIVTHVHIDHVGRIPYLLAAGFKGPIICSEPSAKLLPLVLEDALKIGFTHDKYLIEKFIKQIDRMLQTLAYNQWFSIPSDESASEKNKIKVKLKPAGHILGSAYVECLLLNKNKKNELFSQVILVLPIHHYCRRLNRPMPLMSLCLRVRMAIECMRGVSNDRGNCNQLLKMLYKIEE